MASSVTLTAASADGGEVAATLQVASAALAPVAGGLWSNARETWALSHASPADILVDFAFAVAEKITNSSDSSDAGQADSWNALLADAFASVRTASSETSLFEALRVNTPVGLARLQRLAKAQKAAGASSASASPARGAPAAFLKAAQDGSAAGLLQFGGQGYAYFPELQSAYAAFPAAVGPLVAACSAALKEQAVAAAAPGSTIRRYHAAHGINVEAWLQGGDAAVPSADYLQSAPISFPLIGLTQLANYAVLLHLLGLTEEDGPGALLSAVAGATGHSQGIVAAVAAASATTWTQFIAASVTAVKLLFWQGTRMQEAADELGATARMPLPPATAKDGSVSTAASEAATHMLSVSGVSPDVLKKQIAAAINTIAKAEGAAAATKAATSGAAAAAATAAAASAEAAAKGVLGPAALSLSLVNGFTSCVVSGRPGHLRVLWAALEAFRATPGADQSRIPHSKRKPVVTMRYIKVSAPYHCHLLAAALPKAVADCAKAGVSLNRAAMHVPVLSTADGRDLRTMAIPPATGWEAGTGDDLVSELIRLQTVLPVDWRATVAAVRDSGKQGLTSGALPAINKRVTHVLDVGPGGASGTARLTARLLQGCGIGVVVAYPASLPAAVAAQSAASAAAAAPAPAASAANDDLAVSDCSAIMSSDAAAVSSAVGADWANEYGPRLVRRVADGKLLLDTRYARLLGRAPVMVAGMTPCTSYYGIPLVAACTNAGFHAELACGGLPRLSIFRERIAKLQAQLQPGHGIGLNMLYLNAKQWGFQYPAVASLIKEGVPIETVCIAAGVPTLETGTEIIRTLAAAGVRYVSLKPGSVDAIKRCVELAAAVAPFPIVLQWTGGRAGGHHSFEDVHAPIAATYPLIRRHSNIVLLAGSGMGSASCAVPWVTGTWAVEGGWSAAPMPFDGVLMASRVMVAAEAATSYEVKQVLVATPGITDESQWETSYDGVAGGILTVKSELGEPIHKVANRGMAVWREFDTRFFALPRDKRGAAVKAAKDYIIQQLNDNFQKTYFGRKWADAGALLALPASAVPSEALSWSACDPALMTYAEVAVRMLETMYVNPQAERLDVEPAHENYTQWGRWLDPTFQDRLFVFLQRAEATLRAGNKDAEKAPRLITSASQLAPGARTKAAAAGPVAADAFLFDHPRELVSAFFNHPQYAPGARAVLSAADFDLWMEDCKTRGKPVPFVPVVDEELEVWFKKDSLWYSEDLAAVPQRDAGRVAILQGPVAVAHSNIVNEPVADILNGVADGLVAAVLQRVYGGVETAVPAAELLGGAVDAPVKSALTNGYVRVSTTSEGDSGVSTTYSFELTSAGVEANPAPAVVLEEIVAQLRYGPVAAAVPAIVLAWVLALLSSAHVVHDSGDAAGSWKWASNPAQRALRLTPTRALQLTVLASNTAPSAALHLVERAASVGSKRDVPLVSAKLVNAESVVAVTFHDTRPATPDAPAAHTPLVMRLAYRPTAAYAPLMLHVPTWCAEVKRYYASLWFTDAADTASLDVAAPLVSSYVLTAEDVEAFNNTTGNVAKKGSAGGPAAGVLAAPTSFAIVAGWRALIKCLFPPTIDGDILSLVHLTNSFSLVNQGSDAPAHALAPVTVGETITAKLYVTEVVNGPSGKVVTCQGLLSRSGGRYGNASALPWCNIRSQFLFRGAFNDHQHSFRTTLPDAGSVYTVSLSTAAAVAVLQSKEWFKPAADFTLAAGDVLRFNVHSRETFADAANLAAVTVTGTVSRVATAAAAYGCPALPVGTVEYTWPPSGKAGGAKLGANPVIAYLNRAGAGSSGAEGDDAEVELLESGGTNLMATPDVTQAPADNTAYAVASRDLNPIHRNAAIADLAGLPATIVHGMWTSANGQRVLHAALDAELGNVDAAGKPVYSYEALRLVRHYSASFTGMVMPGDKLVTQITHVGQRRGTGQRVLRITSSAVRIASGAVEQVLIATAYVDAVPSAYVFTGQGSASVGMGQDLYASSAVAKAVWDIADTHLQDMYGFSILEIVRKNPTRLTVHFGGRRGAAIRRNYMALEVEAADGSGPKALLPEINEHTDSHTFMHPEGLLFATQFTQPALVLMEKAAFDDMKAHHFIPERALFAGHSLGEYAALSSAVPLLPVTSLVSLVFLRGMVMQGAVPRDAAGRSDFAMAACNPQRVGPFFTEPVMHQLVEAISKHSGCLLEVVNYNVAERQYVVAGHVVALDILSHTLNIARKEPAAAGDPPSLLKRAFKMTETRAAEAEAAGRKLVLERGEATIPLPGVDVPFHSRFLLGGVPGFRNVLKKQVARAMFSAPGMLDRMLGCYVPNLVALPFSLERYFVDEVVRRTSSPALLPLVASPEAWAAASADPAALAHTLVIELLAYQFASPVQWIATQHFFFSGAVQSPAEAPELTFPAHAAVSPALPSVEAAGFSDAGITLKGIRRLVELGPAITLVGMAARTLETGRYGNAAQAKRRSLLWYGKDSDVLYGAVEHAGPSAEEYASSKVAADVKAALAPPAPEPAAAPAAAAPAPAPAPVAAPAPAPVAAPPAPAPAPAPRPAPVAPAASSSGPVADETATPLEALQVMLAVKLNQPLSVVKPDATIKSLVGGKSAVQNEILGELEKEFGGGPDGGAEMPLTDLAKAVGARYKGPGKVTSALISKMLGAKLPGGFGIADVKAHLSGERMLGPGRVDAVLLHGLTLQPEGRLTGEADAKAWLDKATDSYAASKGITIGKASQGGMAAAGGAGSMSLSPELLAALLGGGGGGGGGGGNAGPIPDAPVTAIEFLRTMLAVKLSQPLSAVKPDATIKSLVGGKSAVQNEILGELEKEFGSGPEGGAELPLTEVAKAVQAKYKGLGKVSTALINKMLGAKMPGGFGAADIRGYLSTARGLGPGRTDSVLLHGLTLQPEGRLATEAEAKAWLDKATDSYGAEYGVDVSRSAGGGGGGAAGAGAGAALAALLGGARGGGDSAAFTAYQKRMAALAQEQIAAYQSFINADAHAPLRQLEAEQGLRAEVEGALALWRSEHGEAYEAGIKPSFDANKQRLYESAWAWGVQDVLQSLYNRVLPSGLAAGAKAVRINTAAALMLLNRAGPEAAAIAKYGDALTARVVASAARALWAVPRPRALPAAAPVSELALTPLAAAPATRKPVYAASFTPTAPRTTISAAGKLSYAEVPRPGVPCARAYVVEMARDAVTTYLGGVLAEPLAKYPAAAVAGGASVSSGGAAATPAAAGASLPYLHLRSTDPEDSGNRKLDSAATAALFSALLQLTTDLPDTLPLADALAADAGVSFAGKVALVTGCGAGSIGIELVKGLLAGGATVVATTSRFNINSTGFFRRVYQESGSAGSRLFVLPFNQGSAADCTALVSHVYDTLQLDVDYLIPFGAISENGHEVDSLDGSSELAHRLMLTNVLRLLGGVANAKRSRGIATHPALALLPLSPNHGVFGSDGLYAESKLGLEALNHKWASEGWGDYVSIAGAVIGWTRGTGLMASNNVVSQGVEELGCRTFSQAEMALNLMALLHPRMAQVAAEHPVWADFRGGFHAVPDLKSVTGRIRKELESQAAMARAVAADKDLDKAAAAAGGSRRGAAGGSRNTTAPPAAAVRLFEFPPLPAPDRVSALNLQGALTDMLDLDRTVVVTGYGEVCPWGNARTRWEMEASGEFSLEGAILMAWVVGKIKYYRGPHPTPDAPGASASYAGWVDAATGEPVPDAEVKSRYEADILAHAGIRVVEPALFDGYDPHRKLFLHQIALDRDMAWIEVASKDEAEEYRLQLGADKVDVKQEEDGTWRIRLKRGATLSVPRAMRFDRWVAGQVPTGWDATRFGIPADMIGRLDPVVLYSLVAVSEALIASGVTDPYELFNYVHVSDVGNAAGGGMGGMTSLRRIYKQRFQEGDMPSDQLQEAFINTVPAWINMLLLSASGPIKTPVGACATAAESVDIAVDAITSGKAQVMIVGGYDDFCEEGSYEFAQMGATSSSAVESSMGREPSEMCRPMAPSRGGFMEAQGSGMQILMTARLAVAMGVPIYGIVALTNTATDKNGRSVPAPGQGVLTTAREAPAASLPGGVALPSPTLDVNYRRKRLAQELERVAAWKACEEADVEETAAAAAAAEGITDAAVVEAHVQARTAAVAREAAALESAARRRWCLEFWHRDPAIAPLRGALAVFGLGPDDITAASFHGTGTHANDLNESEVTHTQMSHLGRTPGNPLYVVAQKGLTGHPKGAAAAWMLNGALQMLQTGLIPGNRNADDIDIELRRFSNLAYINRPLALGPGNVKAVLLKSFGFGQAGGEVLVVHPDYLLAALPTAALASYTSRRGERERVTARHAQEVLAGRKPLVGIKPSPPYTKEQEHRVYLNPTARARYDAEAGSYRFFDADLLPVGNSAGVSCGAATTDTTIVQLPSSSPSASAALQQALAAATAATLASTSGAEAGAGVGVDVEPISTFAAAEDSFLARNFTAAELSYCGAAANRAASLAGRWAAKEAVVKALTSAAANRGAIITLPGSGAPLADIEIVASSLPIRGAAALSTSGAPTVRLSGHAATVAEAAGVDASAIRVTISHAGDYAVAVAATSGATQ